MFIVYCIEVKLLVWSDLKFDKEIIGFVFRWLFVMKEEFVIIIWEMFIYEINELVVDVSDLKLNFFFDFRKLLFWIVK